MAKRDTPTLLIIDGHSLAFRAFYALPPESFRLESGQYTNAIHGFLGMLLSLIDHEHPTHLAVAFDVSRRSFRTDEYPEYKGTRTEAPPEFAGQVDQLQRVLAAMNITILTKHDYEGDDILATLATRGEGEGMKVLVVSGDRDAFQLVDGEVTLLYPVKGVSQLTRYTPQKVEEKYGVPPERYPDIAALVGETSDNLPGVPGVGPKTAAKWINEYGDVEAIIAAADGIKGKAGASLRERVGDVRRNRKLNRLVRDVPLDVDLHDLAIRPVDHERVAEVFGELQLRTMRARVQALDGTLRKVPGGGAPAAGASGGSSGRGSVPDVAADQAVVITAEPPLQASVCGDAAAASWLNERSGTVGLAFDTLDGRLTGITATDGDAAIVHAFSQEGNQAVAAWLSSDAPKAVHNSKDAYELAVRSGTALAGVVEDSELAWYLYDSTRSDYSLRAAETQFFTQEFEHNDDALLGDDALIDDSTSQDWRVLEAWQTLRLGTALHAQLRHNRGSQVLERIELPLAPVLARMELAGVAVDREKLQELADSLGDRAAGIASEAYKVIGHEINLASPKQLQHVLFDELGMPKTRKTKTGYSTNVEALTDLLERTQHPFLELLMAHRDATKLSQMVQTLLKAIGDDGRVHTTYQQVGTATGRLSSTDPNLQNIPVRTEEGRKIRDGFVAGPGYETLLSADYSQIEMRIMAHLSGDEGLIEAFRSGEDLHRYVGSKVFGVPPSEVTDEMRSKVKAMSYGLVYGLSAFGLSRQLRISRDEAKDLMSGYFMRFGGVRDYLRNVVEQAREDGYTETIFGRRRPFADLHSRNRVLRDNAERAALNAPIQGSAADIIKRAMITVDQELSRRGLASRMLLQVHDELILEVAAGELDEVTTLVTDRMAGAADLSVPLDVHIGVGKSWHLAAH